MNALFFWNQVASKQLFALRFFVVRNLKTVLLFRLLNDRLSASQVLAFF